MENVVVEISKFVILILMTIYTFFGFSVVLKKNQKRKRHLYAVQRVLIFSTHFIGNMVLYITTMNLKVLVFYVVQLAFLAGFSILYALFYKGISKSILNHMMMLFSVSFVMLTRISYDSGWRQFVMSSIAMTLGLVVPVIIKKMKILMKMQFIYSAVGIGMLVYVYGFGVVVYGAKNWIRIGGTLIQPSEFVKILFVFFIASALAGAKDMLGIMITSGLAGAHVLLLVVERDLGAALILFLTYIIVLYVATNKSFFMFGGLFGGAAASIVAYQLFPHVQVRVSAWLNPWATIDSNGYQVAQSLFAIGTGGWFGMGIGKGLPTSIPVGKSDFIFSAISEEYGGIFAIWIMLIYVSLFIMFITIALHAKEVFYKLTALGFSVMFIVQVFLSIGGVTKFIPSTGVTLPLLSYGGSSVLSTVIVFSILQGIYMMNQNEDGRIEKRKVRRTNQKENAPVIREVAE